VPITRRSFIHRSLGVGATLVVGCGPEDRGDGSRGAGGGGGSDTGQDAGTFDDVGASLPDLGPGPGGDDAGCAAGCTDPFAGGELVRQVPFAREDEVDFHRRSGEGWDGRLRTDLSRIDQDRRITPNEEFFIRTFYPYALDPDDPWSIRVDGLVGRPRELTMGDLESRERSMGEHVLECSGNSSSGSFGLLSAAKWEGVSLMDLLDEVGIDRAATRVLVSGVDEHRRESTHSTPGASWIYSFDQIERAGGFLATGMNGEPLSLDHGFPVRMYMPGWYGCTCIKWVNEIRLVDDSEPSTPQMQEFAGRTHQEGVPAMARDFRPATMDQAAMPIRIEQWGVDDRTVYKVVGISWGGSKVTDALAIRFNDDEPYVPVDVCPPMEGNSSWTVWSHAWRPEAPGRYQIHLAVEDVTVPTNRLLVERYDRWVDVREV
jgi:DMSO/TMAO reductase YedYZ molybdopterin-dependent catalytic subunit